MSFQSIYNENAEFNFTRQVYFEFKKFLEAFAGSYGALLIAPSDDTVNFKFDTIEVTSEYRIVRFQSESFMEIGYFVAMGDEKIRVRTIYLDQNGSLRTEPQAVPFLPSFRVNNMVEEIATKVWEGLLQSAFFQPST